MTQWAAVSKNLPAGRLVCAIRANLKHPGHLRLNNLRQAEGPPGGKFFVLSVGCLLCVLCGKNQWRQQSLALAQHIQIQAFHFRPRPRRLP